jgi:hypothetical protein
MALIRRIGCDLQLDAHTGTPFRKAGELVPHDLALRS